MIDIPKQYTQSIITSTSPTNSIRIHSITDEDKAVRAVERRLSPVRRKAKQSKRQIEQRVSSDRRRSAFSAKA